MGIMAAILLAVSVLALCYAVLRRRALKRTKYRHVVYAEPKHNSQEISP
jgi:hypothetical protein